jgi:hypothetical protein
VLDLVILGATLSKERPPVRLDQSSGLADGHLGVHVRLYERRGGGGATSCWKLKSSDSSVS